MTLIISISGVRGIFGKSLTENVVEDFAKAFATLLAGKKVVLGTDNRDSKDILKKAVLRGLLACGCQIIEVGVCPTPTVQLMVKHTQASGGIVITASHNPAEWNGLKFIRDDGIFLNSSQAEKLIKIYHSKKFSLAAAGSLDFRQDAVEVHLAKIFKLMDTEKIKTKAFKVALDSCRGAGGKIAQELLGRLNCQVFLVDEIRGFEPVPENLGTLALAVKKHQADIGFALDPDADRLSIVSDEAVAIGEEYSLALATDYVLGTAAKTTPPQMVVVNLSTSRMIDDLAQKHGARVIRTKIGEVNVSEKIKESGAIIGGEGNGGIIYPKVGYGRDSLTGMALILQYLAETGKKVSELSAQIPKYYMYKGKISARLWRAKVKKMFKGKKLDKVDGIKIIEDKFWIQLRPSNTEPIVRLIIEADTQKEIEKQKNLIFRELQTP